MEEFLSIKSSILLTFQNHLESLHWGYQLAQKWLKDRKDRVLDFEDILHYQKIIVALTETSRLMEKIDLIGVE